jgi:AAA15 family ATPase/GTPase
MCNSFFVKNFRTFKEIKIEKLAQVNLFLGSNSVGKTALLEAFYLHLHQNKMEAIESLLVKKDEHLSYEDESSSIGSIVRHLFHNHQLPNFNDEGIMLGEINKHKLTKIKTTIDDDDNEVLEVIKNEKSEHVLLRDNFNALYRHREMRFKRRMGLTTYKKINLQFVHSSGSGDIVRMWDKIALTDKQNEVISALRVIEPSLSGIKFVEQDRRSRGRVAQASIDGEIVPFKSMGDGINRILYIVLSMVNAQDGYLLIDEFENGLHYSVQEKVWKVIFSLAESLNVQVFATTHSSDCIEAFGSQWDNNKEKATMHRIDYKNKQHSVMPYDFSDLDDALSTNTEVR